MLKLNKKPRPRLTEDEHPDLSLGHGWEYCGLTDYIPDPATCASQGHLVHPDSEQCLKSWREVHDGTQYVRTMLAACGVLHIIVDVTCMYSHIPTSGEFTLPKGILSSRCCICRRKEKESSNFNHRMEYFQSTMHQNLYEGYQLILHVVPTGHQPPPPPPSRSR